MAEFLSVVDEFGPVTGKLLIGGKSTGGRVATMIADRLYAEGRIAGVLVLGYPFHPPENPAELRTAHLGTLRTPTLITQGTRDDHGSKKEIRSYGLSPAVKMKFLLWANHALNPREGRLRYLMPDHFKTIARATRAWARRLPP